MHVGDYIRDYDEGSIVISPYGLAIVTKLHDEPLKERPSNPDDANFAYAAATLWVNGAGEETIELDALVPATPENVARWNLSGVKPMTEVDRDDPLDSWWDQEFLVEVFRAFNDDEESTLIAEAESQTLVDLHRALKSVSTNIHEELEYRVHHEGDRIRGHLDDRAINYLERIYDVEVEDD